MAESEALAAAIAAAAEHDAADAAPAANFLPPVAVMATAEEIPGTIHQEDPADKAMKRKEANRASAATSRKRKLQATENLQAENNSLRETATRLQQENYELRKEIARLTGAAEPAAPDPIPLPVPIPAPGEISVQGVLAEIGQPEIGQPEGAVAGSALD